MVGRTLNEYEILELLGRGGMGEVYVARDTRLDRKVALKVLPAELAGDPDRRMRFEREARAIAALNHPNIVTVHSVEEVEGLHFITMELIEGRTLRKLIPEDGMALEELFDVSICMADALAAAHKKGITHRDLKPENVMVTHEDRVKVLDFGLAKQVAPHQPGEPLDAQSTETATQEGRIVGTTAYMSPEQAQGKEVDARSDVFALGVVLYEMTTGRRPFEGDTSLELLTSIMRDKPPPMRDVREELPPHLRRIIRSCLEKDPDRRYQTAKTVRNQLESLKKELEATKLTRGTAPSRAPGARRWVLVSVLVTAAIGVAALSAGIAWRFGRDRGGVGRGIQQAQPITAAERRMIVVFPFENLGPADDAYFAAGVTEEITSRLAMVSGLGVISRSSAVQYDRTGKTLRKVADDLGVDYVLEGTVRWARGAGGTSRVRITPQLIRVEDDTHMWADTYERVIDDIFEIQSDIAGSVIRQLGIRLGEPEQRSLASRPTESIEAYDFYTRARHEFYRYTREGNAAAIELYDKALELDGSFVAALAGLSLCQTQNVNLAWSDDLAWLDRAEQTARRALEIDPDSADALFALGFVYEQRSQWDRMESQMRRVLEINPNHPHAHDSLADALMRGPGLLQEAEAEYDTALRLDPFLIPALVNQALLHWLTGRFEAATELYERAVRVEAGQRYGHIGLGILFATRGRHGEAVPRFREAVDIDPGQVFGYGLLAESLVELGDLPGAEACARELADRHPGRVDASHVRRYVAARVALARGDKRQARALLADMIQWGEGTVGEGPALIRGVGAAHLAAGDTREALEYLGVALEDKPYLKILHLDLGRALEAAGEPEAAAAEYRLFLGSWDDADADAPGLREARDRLAALTRR